LGQKKGGNWANVRSGVRIRCEGLNDHRCGGGPHYKDQGGFKRGEKVPRKLEKKRNAEEGSVLNSSEESDPLQKEDPMRGDPNTTSLGAPKGVKANSKTRHSFQHRETTNLF